MHGYYSGGLMLDAKAGNLNSIERGLEDRNRTAPFPFCGNRFEFRAVGSSQNCSFPMAMVNTVFADGMRALSEILEKGTPLRDACAQLFTENQRVIFTGNGYSAEWPVEAAARGLPNLYDTILAASAFATPENKALFARMGVFTEAEVDARGECFFENYSQVIQCEASTLIEMVRTGVEPACAADLALYASAGGSRHTKRAAVYEAVSVTCDEIEAAVAKMPEGGGHGGHGGASASEIASYCAYTVKPLLSKVREACDAAEGLVKKNLWPFPSYTDIVFKHHMSAAKV